MTDTDTAASSTGVLAPASKDTLVRLGFVAVLLLGLGCWCIYDGYIAKDDDGNAKYRYVAFSMEKINDFANWAFNRVVGPFVMVPVGLLVLGIAVCSTIRHIEADETGIGVKGKDKIPWTKIARVDASDLAAKQILRLEYGADKPMTLDAYKLTNFKALVAFVDEHVPESAKPALDGLAEDDSNADTGNSGDPES